jgi:Kef-type K+ transport system membrane component KefB
MKKFKNLIFYILTIVGFSWAIYWIIEFGKKLELGKQIKLPVSHNSNWVEFKTTLLHNLEDPLALLLAQIIIIVLASRLVGWLFKKIGQPSVIGEILAGILLGPSLVGMYFPEFSHAIFPKDSLGNLKFLSQIGLIFFMFVVGMELDIKVLKNKAKDAVIISHASIIIPFALGMGLAYFVYDAFAAEGTQFLSFALFMGIAMSITAFPVLARIVQERGIHKTKLGTVIITCAAADDITAWCILAAVIAIVKAGTFVSALYTICLAAIYVLVMLKVVRPFLTRIGEINSNRNHLNKQIVAIFFIVLLFSAWATESIGIHALFGAFMAGAIMPESTSFRDIFITKVEDIALILLLPLFFVFTGLRTEIGLLNEGHLWMVTGIIIAVAVTGKFFGSALAAKFVGQSWKDSLIIGALMNTRGLMELIVLNIGYDLGILSKEIFTMLVIMALVTTFMTGPALDFIEWIFTKVKGSESEDDTIESNKFRILLSFGNPERGKVLLRLANSLVRKLNDNAEIDVMHLAQTNEIHQFDIKNLEKETMNPIKGEAKQLKQKITTIFRASNDVSADVANEANKSNYDLLLIGIGQSIYEGSFLGKVLGFTTRIINPERIKNKLTGKEKLFDKSNFDDRTRDILLNTNIPVGVLIEKNLSQINNVIIPFFSESDVQLVNYFQKMITNAEALVTVVDINGFIKSNEELSSRLSQIQDYFPNHLQIISEWEIEKTLVNKYDIMLVSIESWESLVVEDEEWLNNAPSTLILKSALV